MIPADSTLVEKLLAQGSFTLKNAMVSGAIILAVGGILIAYLRRLPQLLWAWFLRRFTISVEVLNSDQTFTWVQVWLDAQPYTKRSRQLSARAQYLTDSSVHGLVPAGQEQQQYITLMPAPGNHFFFYRRRPVWLSFVRDHDGGTPSGGALMPRETISIRVLGRSQDVIRALLLEAREMAVTRNRTEPRIFISVYNNWRDMGLLRARPIDSVILPEGAVARVVEDCHQFLNSQAWYAQRGIPYRRGWLFYGRAGTGKTSLVGAVAGELRRSLYIINMGAVERDSYLLELLMGVPAGSMILFEDIDTAMRARGEVTKDSDEVGVTLGGLLNALDGLVAQEGGLVFMTTNYKDRLDPALIRPGRIDARLEFDAATEKQLGAAFVRFYGTDEGALEFVTNARQNRPVVMCEVQEHLLRHRDNPKEAARLASTIGVESAA